VVLFIAFGIGHSEGQSVFPTFVCSVRKGYKISDAGFVLWFVSKMADAMQIPMDGVVVC
jgi:hypothetical protein